MKRADRLVIYREHSVEFRDGLGEVTHGGDYRWTLYAPNGRVIGASSEGYRTRIDAERNAARVLGIETAPIDAALATAVALVRSDGSPIRVEATS